MRKLILAAVLLGAAAFYFYPKDTKEKHCVHDEKTYLNFCRSIVSDPEVYRTFRSHPLYTIFQENIGGESAAACLAELEKKYPHLLAEKGLIASLDAIGTPHKIEGIGLPTLRNLKIGGDIEKYFGSLTGKTIVQIGASDGSLCKILMKRHHPARYCIVDIPPALEVAKKTLAEWGVDGIEFSTPEEFAAPQTIDLAISPFVFSESRRNIQQLYVDRILRHTQQGYLDCRFPMRHFGLKTWTQEQILSHLEKIGKKPQVIIDEPLTDIDRCLILFAL